ncbi:hypothetical protein AYK20_06560 [Thermoplasmatales archaeon SG8-52-1]|nr:MAG: hypothetical protein AYK20_06560 [Thermoplasmatales archaeon SG8-52-1]
MRNIIRKYIVLFLIILYFCSSVFIVLAGDNKLSKADFIDDSSIFSPNAYIEKQKENGEGGEDKNTPFNELENDFLDREEESKNSQVILGNQVRKDGSNGLEKHPVYIILAITSLITIIMLYIIRKK